MIRPTFANTASFTTRKRYILRGGKGPVTLPVRCGLVIHPSQGPILIDAGCGPRLTQGRGRSLALRAYNWALRPKIYTAASPIALLDAHGFKPDDVNQILVTHLHADHVGYLNDFPHAVFITDDVLTGSLAEGVFAELLPDDFVERQVSLRSFPTAMLPFGLGDGFDILGDGSILALPLPGHAQGHFGLCFTGDTPLLYAVDAQWLLAGISEDRSPGFPASLIAHNAEDLRESMALVRRFANAGGEVMLCHDPAQTPYDWSPPNV